MRVKMASYNDKKVYAQWKVVEEGTTSKYMFMFSSSTPAIYTQC